MLNNPEPAFNALPEYMAPGLPWVTSSIATPAGSQISFPKVTNFIQIRNNESSGGSLHVGFTRNGVLGGNKFVIPPATSETFEVRVSELWLASTTAAVSCSLLAGLTAIPARFMPLLSGTSSGSFGWSGVG